MATACRVSPCILGLGPTHGTDHRPQPEWRTFSLFGECLYDEPAYHVDCGHLDGRFTRRLVDPQHCNPPDRDDIYSALWPDGQAFSREIQATGAPQYRHICPDAARSWATTAGLSTAIGVGNGQCEPPVQSALGTAEEKQFCWRHVRFCRG